MRTTITIDAGLLIEVKRRAAEKGSTVSKLIADSLRLSLSAPEQDAEEGEGFELLTFGRGGKFSKYNIDKASSLVEADDLERFGRSQRSIFVGLLRSAGAKGALVADAYLAAMAIEHGCELVTTDSDFARFEGLRWRHPLAPI